MHEFGFNVPSVQHMYEFQSAKPSAVLRRKAFLLWHLRRIGMQGPF